jgi:hypothetical protein
MNPIQQLDIDDVRPVKFDREIAEQREWNRTSKDAGSRRLEPRTRRGYNNSTPGIKLSSLYDWRSLERTMYRLSVRLKQFETTWWDYIRNIVKRVKEARGREAWIVRPDDPAHVDVIYAENIISISTRSVEEIVKFGVNDPVYKGVLINGEAADMFHHLSERTNAWRRRFWIFQAAFHTAVEARLEVIVKKELREPYEDFQRYYHTSGIFLLKNDDRHYFITSSENGAFAWGAGKIYEVI